MRAACFLRTAHERGIPDRIVRRNSAPEVAGTRGTMLAHHAAQGDAVIPCARSLRGRTVPAGGCHQPACDRPGQSGNGQVFVSSCDEAVRNALGSEVATRVHSY